MNIKMVLSWVASIGICYNNLYYVKFVIFMLIDFLCARDDTARAFIFINLREYFVHDTN